MAPRRPRREGRRGPPAAGQLRSASGVEGMRTGSRAARPRGPRLRAAGCVQNTNERSKGSAENPPQWRDGSDGRRGNVLDVPSSSAPPHGLRHGAPGASERKTQRPAGSPGVSRQGSRCGRTAHNTLVKGLNPSIKTPVRAEEHFPIPRGTGWTCSKSPPRHVHHTRVRVRVRAPSGAEPDGTGAALQGRRAAPFPDEPLSPPPRPVFTPRPGTHGARVLPPPPLEAPPASGSRTGPSRLPEAPSRWRPPRAAAPSPPPCAPGCAPRGPRPRAASERGAGRRRAGGPARRCEARRQAGRAPVRFGFS